MSDDETSDFETSTGKPSQSNPPEAKPEIEPKVKRAHRVLPTFEASMLNDPQKGLQSLLHKLEKIEDSALDGSRESLSLIMRTYQGWLYNSLSS
jgi:hypothetical protein